MKGDDVSRRLRRLQSGRGTPRDLDAVFLWIREHKRSFGNKLVEEIGHFVAHADERTKGISWERINQFATMSRFFLPRVRGIMTQSLADLRGACFATLEIQTSDEVRSRFGHNKQTSKRMLERAFDGISEFTGKTVIWKRQPSKAEKDLVNGLCSVLVVKPAFTEEDLGNQFVACVQRNGLVSTSTPEELSKLIPFVSLYVVEKMHLARIALANAETALLQASADAIDANVTIAVRGAVAVELDDWTLQNSFDVYDSTLKLEEWTDTELRIPGSEAWRYPLEIGPDWKLRMLP